MTGKERLPELNDVVFEAEQLEDLNNASKMKDETYERKKGRLLKTFEEI